MIINWTLRRDSPTEQARAHHLSKGLAIELWDLKCFLAVAEHSSFSGAAKSLHLSTQAVSRSVRKLEDELGFKLFERTTRTVRLTAAGARLRADASRALAELDGSVELASRIALGESGVIAIGFDLAEIIGTMPVLVSTMAKRHPDVEVRIASYNLPRYDDLRSGKLDAYFATAYNDSTDGFNSHIVQTSPLYIALPKGHRLSSKEALVLADLHGEKALFYRTDPESPIVTRIREESIDYELVADTGQLNSWITLIGLAGAGRGFVIVSEQYRAILPDLVDYRPIDEPGFVTQTRLLWRKGDDNPLIENALLETARSLWR